MVNRLQEIFAQLNDFSIFSERIDFL